MASVALRKLLVLGLVIAFAAAGPTKPLLSSCKHVAGTKVCSGTGIRLNVGEYNATLCNSTAWTLRDLWHKSFQLLSPTGFTGCVSNLNIVPNTGEAHWPPLEKQSPSCPVIKQGPNGPPAPGSPSGSGFLGTGHGGEIVYTLTLLVGQNETYDLLGEGHGPALPSAGMVWPADTTLTFRKHSQIGPFLATQDVTLDAALGLTVSARLTLGYDAPVSSVNWLYPAMTMFSLPFKRWVAETADGRQVGGVFLSDGSFSLKENIQWAAVFDDDSGRGAVYQYPFAYNGSGTFRNSIWNRAYDHKLYLRLDPARVQGDKVEVRHTVEGFLATNLTWVQTAKSLVRSGTDFVV